MFKDFGKKLCVDKRNKLKGRGNKTKKDNHVNKRDRGRKSKQTNKQKVIFGM
jgi:hypothetical protein